MHAVIRMYSGVGARDLVGVLEARKAEVEQLIRSVKGFISYSMIRTPDGAASVTVCEDKAGTDESMRIAAGWIKANAPSLGVAPPSVVEGSAILHLK
jgi:hypothetical protein